MASDSLAVADAVVGIIQASITLTGMLTTVSREYEFEYDLGKMTGLKVHVYPAMNGDMSRATRSESNNEVGGCIVVAQRYTSPGLYTKVWVDTLVEMVEVAVFNELNKLELPLLETNGYQYWIKEAKIEPVYNIQFLRKHKVFWSECEYMFSRFRVR